MQKLKITNCKNHIEEFTLAGGSYTIGRSLDSTLRLEGEEVSRLHARLFVTANRCELMDDASKNGTFVNGNRITSYFLNDGDTIKIGRFNLKYISDNIKPEEKERKTRKGARYFFLLALTLAGFLFYQNILIKRTLAQRTAQYLAERNKEALYLGEYSSIDLTNLPQGVIQVAIWDRHGILRAGAQPPDVRGRSSDITIPIYYESVMVGKLWMRYKL